MQPFAYQRAQNVADAARGRGVFIAGGTTLADLMKLDVMQPDSVVDINPLEAELGAIEVTAEGLRLGALVRMAEAEKHPRIIKDYPVIADTLRLAASPQIRNMASLGGNLLQRTRCDYFRGEGYACNKRMPGAGCAAREGYNRQHAVLGTSDHCIATYPGDFALALTVLEASVVTNGPRGQRTIPIAELHRPPGNTPEIETTLDQGELITSILVPASAWASRSTYVKIRDRQSYAFALTSAAVALQLEGDTVKRARIALGGLATVPWRAKAAEAALEGKALDEKSSMAAAEVAFAEARPLTHNAFKVALGKATLVRALMETRDMKV